MAEETFGFDGNTTEGNDFKFITVDKVTAVQEGIYFEDFKVDKWDGKEDMYLEVTVRNKQGQTCNRRYNQPSIDGNIVKDEAGLKKANNKFAKIAKNISTKVLGDNVAISGKTWAEFVNNLISKIKANPNWNKIELRALFVHDKAGYTKLRSFSPIFELASIAKADSKLVPGDYDNYIVKQTPSTESSGLTTETTTPADIF